MIPHPHNLQYREFQAEAIRQMRSMRSIYLGDEMGLGKTVQAIGLVNDDVTLVKILIVCPAAVKLNWQRELGRWLCRDLTVDVAYGKSCPRADILIINYDILRKHPNLQRETWDLLVVDESHYLKSPDAKRTTTVGWLTAKRRLYMSGTPIPNRPIELWAPLDHLQPGQWGSYHSFGLRYAGGWLRTVERHDRDITYWDYSGATNLQELSTRLRDSILIRRVKADVLKELPPKVRQLVPLGAVPARLQRRMDKLVDPALTAEEYHTAVGRLSVPQSPEFEEISEVRRQLAEYKVPLCVDWIKAKLEGVGKLIVFAHHHSVLDSIAESLEGVVQVDGRVSIAAREKRIKRFQEDPDARVFVGGIQAAGVGVTLTASSHVVFCELDWVPGNVTQAEDRAHRIGQDQTVNVYHLVLDDSLDSRIASAIVYKQNTIDAALQEKSK